ncbi:MAG: phytanoyl-CoA dioxygenase family protein [bacterium]|nr:phytanoyl-CoA dioxygenase family protein [Myxococcales bacterium]
MSEHESSAALKARFERDGFVVVPGVVEAERVAALRAAFDALVEVWAAELGVSRAEYERVVSQWTSMHEHDPAFRAQLHHPRVAALGRALLGVERVQLFHDHFISKPPGVSSTIPWHQDYPFWPVDEPRALSCWLALDDADDESGAMWFMPGAHREGEQPPVDFLRNQKDWGARIAEAVPTRLRAGDCVFHSCLSWHTSPPNRSARQRRALITIMMSAECRYDPAHSDWHPMNAAVTVAPGERFNLDRFPLLGEGAPC